jgi:hypothetical protein
MLIEYGDIVVLTVSLFYILRKFKQNIRNNESNS